MGVKFEEAGLPTTPTKAAQPTMPAKPVKKKGTPKASKPFTLPAWTTQFTVGYAGGIPSPIWKESHGALIEAMFKYAKGRDRFGIGLNGHFRTVWFPSSASDSDTRVKGTVNTISAVVQRETFRYPWLSTSSSYLIGGGFWTKPEETVTTPNAGSVVHPRKSISGGPVMTSRTGFNFHVVPNWLTISPFFGIRVDEPKAAEFTGMSLLLGINVSLSLGPKPTHAVDVGKKQNPNWYVFSHDIASQVLKLVHQSYTIRPSNDYETIQRAIDLGTGEPGNLTYLPPIKLLNGVISMYNSATARDRFFLYDDWRGWLMPLIDAAGAAYLFTPRQGVSGGTAGRTVGFSSLFNVASTLAFTRLRTSMQRDRMDDATRKKEARAALLGSFAINFAGALLGGGLIGAGLNTENSRGMFIGSTLSQGAGLLMSIPGIPTKTSVEYMVMYHFGSGGNGALGGAKIRRSYEGLDVGVEVIAADPMLVGAHKKDGKFATQPMPSFICVSPGYQLNKKHWNLHVGPQQCFREGGRDHMAGSLGAQLSLGARYPFMIKKREIALTGSVTAAGGWVFGTKTEDTQQKPNNSGAGFVGVGVGLEF